MLKTGFQLGFCACVHNSRKGLNMKENKKKQKKTITNNATVNAIINQEPSDTDPNGSYTGKPLDQNEVPVQDADDL